MNIRTNGISFKPYLTTYSHMSDEHNIIILLSIKVFEFYPLSNFLISVTPYKPIITSYRPKNVFICYQLCVDSGSTR